MSILSAAYYAGVRWQRVPMVYIMEKDHVDIPRDYMAVPSTSEFPQDAK